MVTETLVLAAITYALAFMAGIVLSEYLMYRRLTKAFFGDEPDIEALGMSEESSKRFKKLCEMQKRGEL